MKMKNWRGNQRESNFPEGISQFLNRRPSHLASQHIYLNNLINDFLLREVV
ncbi:hypothetical protein VRK_39440 [Vibrio sp. MEBiC08052]|nr:hypothetical protein VRK_39440 [Vibrio sp. MEBiC08052]